MASSRTGGGAWYAAQLRHHLRIHNERYCRRLRLDHRVTYGDPPVICYLPSPDDSCHGNFLPRTWRAILKNDAWRKRLTKVHAQAGSSLPREDRRWRELDSSNSSDALLMNIFCFPGTLKQPRLFDLLGLDRAALPEFGVRARVPLLNGRADRTEVDMRLGNLFVEAKLTEADFQSREAGVVESYRDFHEVFDGHSLPRQSAMYLGYQLIRNVLAAHANGLSFCVMADARRPDLREAWYAVLSSVRIVDLRVRCKMITWQELADVLPPKLQSFLSEKYGILSGGICQNLPPADECASVWA